jgi:hypothetical protein
MNISQSSEVGLRLSKNRANIRKFIQRLRENMIYCWELPETPIKSKPKVQKSKKNKVDITPETLMKKTEESLSLIGSNNTESTINLPLDEMVITEDETSTIGKRNFTECEIDDSEEEISNYEIELVNKSKGKFLGQRHNKNQEFLDEFETPDEAILELITFLTVQNVIDKSSVIWEPSCGLNQKIVSVFKNKGFNGIFGTDINYGEHLDFLEAPCPENCDIIITNPPWSQNKKFLEKALDCGLPFAFLIKVEVISTKYLSDVISKIPCCGLLPNNGKFNFRNPKTEISIQVGTTFWFIGNYLPEVLNIDFDYTFLPFLYSNNQFSNDEINEHEMEYDDEDFFGTKSSSI